MLSIERGAVMSENLSPKSGNAGQKGHDNKKDRGLPLSHVLKSCLWAIIGLQTPENLERDFENGKFTPFLVVGVIFTVLFVILLVFLSQLAISYI